MGPERGQDRGLSAAQFGFASGVFFIGYILLEVVQVPGTEIPVGD